MRTTDLKTILERVEAWPQEAREELVRSIDEIEIRYSKVYRVSDDERAALERSAEDMRNNRFATDQEVETLFARFRHA
jgi:hypothetical protein